MAQGRAVNSTKSHHFRSNGSTDPNYSERQKKLAGKRRSLPIASVETRLVEEVKKNDTLIIVGETGSGKTTQLPQFLFNAGFFRDGKSIGITQPRHVAAVTVAKRVAEDCGVQLGQNVGYSIKFDDTISGLTKIKYMTNGLIRREALLDPVLSRYSILIVDEAHERTIHTDVLLGLLKDVQKERLKLIYEQDTKDKNQNNSLKENSVNRNAVRQQYQGRKLSPLKLIIMSASLDARVFSDYFGGAKAVHVQGRQHPVDIHFIPNPIT